MNFYFVQIIIIMYRVIQRTNFFASFGFDEEDLTFEIKIRVKIVYRLKVICSLN